MTDLERELVSFDNLEAAFWEVARGKRYKDEFQRYYMNLEENLIDTQNALIWHTYQPEPTVSFPIREPKLRLITRPQIRDRVVHHALIRLTQPMFEEIFSDASFACRPGGEYIEARVLMPGQKKPFVLEYSKRNGSALCYPKAYPYYAAKESVRKDVKSLFPEALEVSVILHEGKGQLSACRHFSELLRKAYGKYGEGFVLICIDIKGFFNSIDHDVIKELLHELFREHDLICWLFDQIIDAVAQGLPIGFLPSQHEANLIGTTIDCFAQNVLGCTEYVRYMDDIRIPCRNRETAKEILASIDEFCCRKLRLRLSDKKTVIRTFHGYDTFCGYKVFPHHLEPKPATVKRSHKRLRKKIIAFQEGRINAEQLRSSALSLLAYLGHTNQPEDALATECIALADTQLDLSDGTI